MGLWWPLSEAVLAVVIFSDPAVRQEGTEFKSLSFWNLTYVNICYRRKCDLKKIFCVVHHFHFRLFNLSVSDDGKDW
jgi:hypothetical protein